MNKTYYIIIYALFLYFLLPCKSDAQATDSIIKQGIIKIESETFHYREIYNDEDNGSRIKLKLFKNNKEVLSETLYHDFGDAEDYQMELGDFEVKDSLLYIYNYWCWYGICYGSDYVEYGMPYGAQIQIFKLDRNKNMVCSSSKIFMEMCTHYIINMTASERKKYIHQIEKKYNAQFVQGKAAQRLIQEVKLKLHKQIFDNTKGWEKMERAFRR